MSLYDRFQSVATAHTEDATPVDVQIADPTTLIPSWGRESYNGGVFVVEAVAVGQTSGSVNAYRLALHFAFPTGGAVHAVGSCGSGLTCEEDAAWDCTLAVDTPDLVVRVTGDAAEHVEWTIWAGVYAFAHQDV